MITVQIIKEGRPNTLAQLGQWQKERDEPEYRKRVLQVSIKKYIMAEIEVMKLIKKWQDIIANTALEDDLDPGVIEQFQQYLESLKNVRKFIQEQTKELQTNKSKLTSFKEKRVLYSPQYILTQSRFSYDQPLIWNDRQTALDHIRELTILLSKIDKAPNL